MLISIDTLRADRLPAYGYDRVETPAIDRIRRDGVLFQRAYSHTPLTLPSHLTLLTGLLPSRHGVRDNQGFLIESGSLPSLPQVLVRLGYRTGGAVSAYVLRGSSGLGDLGFEFFDDRVPFREGVALGGIDRPGLETLAAAEPWLRAVAGEPFFFFFHLFEPHQPYAPPEPWASRYADPYDGEVAAADGVVGELLELLEELEIYDESLVVLLSDHGEGLGDHGEQEHGVFLYREAIQVPLLVKLPRREQAGETVEMPAGLVDLPATVLHLLGEKMPVASQGRALLAPALSSAERPLYAETWYPRLHYGWSELASIVLGNLHYIHGPKPELYDLSEDPREKWNLHSSRPETAERLRRELETFQGVAPETPAVADEETRRRLEALGYLGGVAREAVEELPDPKERIHLLAILRRAFDAYRVADYAAAVSVFRRVLSESPGVVDAWEHLGLSLHRLERYEEAAAAVEKAEELSGGEARLTLAAADLHLRAGDPEAAARALSRVAGREEERRPLRRRLALLLAERGRLEEARGLLEPLAQEGDPDSLAALGLVLSEAGSQGRAAEALEEAISRRPDLAAAHENLGLVALRQGRWEAAEEASRRAVALDPGRARAWNNLGVALDYQGRPLEALEAWQRAVELEPLSFDTLYNLGVRSFEAGRNEQARQALARFVQSAPAGGYERELARARAVLERLGGP